MQKNVASQKIAFFAFDATTNLPKTGDAANLTAYVSKDFGAVTVLTDTTATEMDATNAKGWYLFDLAQAETNADTLIFTAKSSTANISLVGQQVYTVPANFAATSVNSSGQLDIIKVAGTTQTARDIGASVLLSNGTGTGQVKLASGYVAMTWADIAAPTTAVNLSGTTIATTQKVDVETIKTNPVVNAGTVTFPTTATLASTTNITAGTITTVTNLTNAPTAGDLTATMKTSVENAVWNATTAGHVTAGTMGLALGNAGSAADPWATALPGAYAAGTAGKIIGDNINATISSRAATSSLPTNFSSLSITAGGAAKVDGTSPLTESYAAQGASLTLAQAIYAMNQMMAQQAIAGTTLTIKKRDGATTAKTFTLDSATSPTSISETT